MNTPISRMDPEITAVIQVIEQHTIAFLHDQLSMVPNAVDRCLRHEGFVMLRSITAIVGVGSRAGLYIAFSYDDPLIRAMTRRYTEDLSIAPEEEELYVRETASDIVNVIVGNSTADLARRGELITLSPPVLMEGARTIHARRESTIATLTLHFPRGALDVAFVGPRLMFDEHLNYRIGAS
jgi:CheY-specific phosphatase CheX